MTDSLKMHTPGTRAPRLPPHFGWVVEGELCAMGMPESADQLQSLRALNVGLLVSLSRRPLGIAGVFAESERLHIPVLEDTAPSPSELRQFLERARAAVGGGRCVAVHCWTGLDRTCVFAAAYLVSARQLGGRGAIEFVQRIRPQSLQRTAHQQAVVNFAAVLHGTDLEHEELGGSLTVPPASSQSRFEADFVVLEKIGQGGFGAVFKCRARLDGGVYAVKRVRLSGSLLSLGKAIRGEIGALKALSHRHIVGYFQSWVEVSDDAGWAAADLEDDEAFISLSTSASLESSPSGPVYFICDLCGIAYLDWRVKDDAWGLLSNHGACFCEGCFRAQLLSLGVDPTTIAVEHRQTTRFLYVVMEFCESTLREAIDGNEWWQRPVEERLDVFAQLLHAVSAVHGAGIVHGDIHPANIFLNSVDGRTVVKLGDFGLARPEEASLLARPADEDESEHEHGAALYQPPLQVEHSRKTDLWSIGVVLLEMFVRFETRMERAVCLGRVRSHGQFPADRVPKEHVALVLNKLLIVDPDCRESAAGLLFGEAALDRFVKEEQRTYRGRPSVESISDGEIEARELRSVVEEQRHEIKRLAARVAELELRLMRE